MSVPLVTYDVVAPVERARFLQAYADGTRLESQAAGGHVRVGPIVSFFEAAWLAGLTPGGAVSRKEAYDEPATPGPFVRLREAAGRHPAYVGMRRAAGERFALVTWERGDETSDLELYQTHASGPRFLVKLPKNATPEVSSGLLFTKVGEEGTFLQVMNERKEGAAKAERLVAWRWAAESREVLFDAPFFTLVMPEDGEIEATVTRFGPLRAGVELTTYRVRLRRLEAAAGVPLAPNDWSSDRWKEKPLPDLVELTAAEPLARKASSLE